MPRALRPHFQSVRQTVGRDWRPELLNYFSFRHTNGFTESVNRRLRDRLRAGRGTTSPADLRLWAMARFGGYGPAEFERRLDTFAWHDHTPTHLLSPFHQEI